MSNLIDELDSRVDADDTYYPNPPAADDFVRNAEAMGLRCQQIVDSANSTGCYYEVWAIYPDDEYRIFGREPLALVFEDYSTSVCVAWLAPVQ